MSRGLEEGTQIYLNTPEKPEEFKKLLGENLIPIIKEKEKVKKEEERKASEQQFRGRLFWRQGRNDEEYDSGNEATISEYEKPDAGRRHRSNTPVQTNAWQYASGRHEGQFSQTT